MWMVDGGVVDMILYDIIQRFSEEYSDISGEICGNSEINIDGMNLCNRETEYQSIISYVSSDKYINILETANSVKALIVNADDFSVYRKIIMEKKGALIVTSNPERYFYRLHEFLYAKMDFYPKYDFRPVIGRDCNIANSAVIENGVIIGNKVTIGENTVIKHGSVIEDNVTIGCNTTIGSEGFQLIADVNNPPMHISHAGGCYLSKNVYVGDNCCVCNSLFEGYTFVGENTKIDNLVHVAHNLYIGKNVVVTAHVILCGSSRVEDGAWIAPNSSVLNRVTIGRYAKVGMGSVVTRDVLPGTIVFGSPAKEHKKKC